MLVPLIGITTEKIKDKKETVVNPGDCLSFELRLSSVALKRFSKFSICFLDLLRARRWSFGETIRRKPFLDPGLGVRGVGRLRGSRFEVG